MIVLTILGTALLVGCGIACLRGQKWAALAAIPAGILLLFGNIDRVTTFKIGPKALEATLSKKIDDADTLIGQLRDFAAENAKLLIRLRETSPSVSVERDQFAAMDIYKTSVLQSLKHVGVPQDKINEVDRSDRDWVINFYQWAFLSYGISVADACTHGADDAGFAGDFRGLTDEQKRSADELITVYGKHHINIEQLTPYIEDYRTYLATSQQRRPLEWAKRFKWGNGQLEPLGGFRKPAECKP